VPFGGYYFRKNILMPRILVTNDDGVQSAGLSALAEAMRALGEVYIVAPAAEQSGASHSLTLARPLRIRHLDERVWSVDGTPTDCVILALNKILASELRPDICVSGINYGANLGEDASYSGTVAGALEATILGVPGVALSLATRGQFDFTEAAKFATLAVQKVLSEGLPPGTLLNVNIPAGPLRGARVTRQGVKMARPAITEHRDPRGKPYYWIGEQYYGRDAEEGTDYRAVEDGFVSVTPLRSDLTDHSSLPALAAWHLEDL
jgi:5'-nucleotidase